MKGSRRRRRRRRGPSNRRARSAVRPCRDATRWAGWLQRCSLWPVRGLQGSRATKPRHLQVLSPPPVRSSPPPQLVPHPSSERCDRRLRRPGIGRRGYHPGHVAAAASDSVVRFSRWVAAAGETFDHDRDVTGPSLLRPPLGAPATTTVVTTNTIATSCPLRSTLGPLHQKTGRGTSARPRTRLSSVTRR